MRDPLIPPLAALALGVLAGRYATFGPGDLLLGTAGPFLLGALALWRGARVLAGACCCAGLIAAGVWLEAAHRPGPSPELDAQAREIVILAGCVVEPPAVAGERERFVLELEPGARAQVTLYTRGNEALPGLRYGQRVEMEARVRKPRNFGNPGAFDYVTYLARQDIFWTASAAAGTVRTQPGRCGSALQAGVMALRTAALDRIARLYHGDAYQTGMMQAILIGQSYQLQRVWTEQYRATGTFHALVISGTHVAVLAGFLLLLLRLCFVPEAAALSATVLAAWLYALVTGWQAPCVRSAAGMTLFAIGRYFYREGRILNLLAAVAIGFLAFDPGQLFEPSFQLTFLAVAFIGAFAAPLLEATSGPLARGLAGLEDTGRDLHLEPRVAQFRVEMRLLAETVRLWTRLPERAAAAAVALPARLLFFVWEIVLISAVVQIGLALPMVVYFHRVGASGLSANALVVPLMGLVVPVGFVAVFSGWPWAGKLGGWLLAMSKAVVDWHARLEPNWRVPAPPLWVAVSLALALIAAASLRGKWRAAAAAGVAMLVGVLLWHPFPPRVEPRQLEMTAIDVGQGDSILVAFPDRTLMVVDGGGIPAFGGRAPHSQMEIGEDVVAPYLWNRSVRQVDVLVMSHAHDDHIGGLPALLADFHPRELWTGAVPDSPAWKALRERAAAAGVRVVPLAGPKRFAFGGAAIEVLAPPPDYVPAKEPRNNDSLVMRVCYGRHAFLLSGDVERQVEWQMADAGALARCDVLKVPHHGSRTSTTEDLLNAVRPQVAVISAGADNSYGHPHAAVLERLAQHGVQVLRTDRDGLVAIRSDGQRLTVDTGRWMDRAGPRLLNVF